LEEEMNRKMMEVRKKRMKRRKRREQEGKEEQSIYISREETSEGE